MLSVFFFLVSLVTDYETVVDLAQRAFTAGTASACVFFLIAARLASRNWFASRERVQR